jgi:hypothetical protein
LSYLFLWCECDAYGSQVDIDENILDYQPVNVRKLLEYFEGSIVISDQQLAVNLQSLFYDAIVFGAEAHLEETLKIVLDYLV